MYVSIVCVGVHITEPVNAVLGRDERERVCVCVCASMHAYTQACVLDNMPCMLSILS